MYSTAVKDTCMHQSHSASGLSQRGDKFGCSPSSASGRCHRCAERSRAGRTRPRWLIAAPRRSRPRTVCMWLHAAGRVRTCNTRDALLAQADRLRRTCMAGDVLAKLHLADRQLHGATKPSSNMQTPRASVRRQLLRSAKRGGRQVCQGVAQRGRTAVAPVHVA